MKALREPLDELMGRYRSCAEPGSKVLELLSIVDMLFRVDGLRLCASLLTDEGQQEESISGALVGKSLGGGSWLSVIERLIKLPQRQGGDHRRWFETHCGAGHFQELLDFRNAYAHCQGSRKPAELAAKLREIERTLDACLSDRPELNPFVCRDGELFWCDGERSVPCAPLLLPGSLVGADDSVLCFSRRDDEQSLLRYLLPIDGEKHVPAAKQYYAQLVQLVARKSAQTQETIGRRPKQDAGSAAVLGRRFRQYAERSLQRSATRQAGSHPLVERLEADAWFQGWWSGPTRVLVVVGPEGAGVSCWLRQLVERRLQASQAVVFDSATDLPEKTFPEVLMGGLGCSDGATRVVHQAARESSDGQLLVVLDDLALGGKKNGLLYDTLSWSGRQSDGDVRIVLGLRSAEYALALKRSQESAPDERMALLAFPRFSAHEVRLLAEILPCVGDAQRELDRRRKLAAQLLESDEDATRRPRFLVDILRNAEAFDADHLELSPVALRARQFETACQAKSRTLREPLAQHLADTLLDRRELRVALFDPALRDSRLVFTEHGAITRIYEDLLVSGLFIEESAPEGRVVGFASTAMFAFAAARRLDLAAVWQITAHLVTVSQDFEPALDVAAHAVVRWAALPPEQRPGLMGVQSREPLGRLLPAVAALDRRAFLTLLHHLLEGSQLDWLLPALIAIGDKGQSRTASIGLSLLARAPKASAGLAERARIANGYALWDLDQYAAMELELRDATTQAPRVQLLRAMIATARGEFETARSLYDHLAEVPDLDPALAAEIPMRSAPALIALGEGERAELQLREALMRLPAHDLRARAEILGHLGEALTEQGRLREAEALYRESMSLNCQLGSLVGQGVCHAVLGDLLQREQHYEEARVELELSLDIARRVDNPWREAWTLLRLARVAQALGDSSGATALAESGRSLFARIGCHAQ